MSDATREAVREIVPGIYMIRNTVNGRKYIGQSKNMRARWNLHLKHLRAGVSPRPIQSDYDLHGIEAFEFSILEIIPDKDERLRRERHLIIELSADYNTVVRRADTPGMTAAEHQRQYRERKAKLGLCLTCPAPAAPGRSKCLPCAEKSLEAARKSLRRQAS